MAMIRTVIGGSHSIQDDNVLGLGPSRGAMVSGVG